MKALCFLSIRTRRCREMKSTHLHYQGEYAWWIITLWLQQHWVSHTHTFPISSFTMKKIMVRIVMAANLHWVLTVSSIVLNILPVCPYLILTSNPLESVLVFTSIFPVTYEDMGIATSVRDGLLKVRLLVTTNKRGPTIETRKWRAWLSLPSGEMM